MIRVGQGQPQREAPTVRLVMLILGYIQVIYRFGIRVTEQMAFVNASYTFIPWAVSWYARHTLAYALTTRM
jgi:hypothetical protein